MKLSSLFNSFNLRFREVYNFARYPIESISRITQRRAQNIYENIEIPGNKQQNNYQEIQGTIAFPERLESNQQYNGYVANGNAQHLPESFNGFNGTVNQTLPRQLIKKQANLSLLQPLKENTEIRGRRGRYRVDNIVLNQEWERVRQYLGIHLLNNKPVCIKEYLLPESDFNQQETRERKDKFEELASVNFKSEEGKDFRLITPWDAIASRDQRRCYLITELVDNRTSLREYLEATQHPMTSQQVRKVLELVLVSLQYLHTDSRINLPLGQRPHGNLSLDSLLIYPDNSYNNSENEQFFIYLSDFALWENLFKSPILKLDSITVEKDLQDLGSIAFYLLNGGDKDSNYGTPFDPKNETHWGNINDISLKHFIRRLLGLDTPFTSAEKARIFLLTPQPYLQNTIEQVIEPEKENESESSNDSKKIPIALTVIIFAFLVGFIGGISWLLLNWVFKGKPPEMFSGEAPICCIEEVGVTEALNKNKKRITYNVSTSETTLRYLMTTPNFVAPRKTFPLELRHRIQKSKSLQLNYKPVEKIAVAIANLKNNQADFFITEHSEEEFQNIPNANELESQPVAYEGIVVFVPFSDSQRDKSLPEALNGKISFEDLQKIYRGEISTWKELNKDLPDLEIKIYIPDDKNLVNRFKEILYKDSNQPDFDDLVNQGKIIRQPTGKTLNAILSDFESAKQIGGIGFGLLSQVYNQCAVYPLSIGNKGQEVQALVQNSGKDINPKTDLCNDKGGYHPNPETIGVEKDYPLKFPISVVYSQDEKSSLAGKEIVKILITDEGQTLFSEAGLVPIRKINEN